MNDTIVALFGALTVVGSGWFLFAPLRGLFRPEPALARHRAGPLRRLSMGAMLTGCAATPPTVGEPEADTTEQAEPAQLP